MRHKTSHGISTCAVPSRRHLAPAAADVTRHLEPRAGLSTSTSYDYQDHRFGTPCRPRAVAVATASRTHLRIKVPLDQTVASF